ncbi:hypothetical protein C3941_10025 [Kaistia algarum]|uniref:RT0821/Lpp0805 family surface protein n=1 Tax=Kaistia algarum TaxID=2083279 RepID=UPI000CE886AC|nr:RT0821/Lpp0805 family surface protein [Kaistia algarum]MCX5512395.1 RT0821/Lpp0805 family surface protein [Kaistia algarum]PPE80475.1 hypothetical protein C3941_10025 [Kaistia algarum]
MSFGRLALALVALVGLTGCGLSPVGGRAELDTMTTGSITPAAPAPTVPDAPPLGYASPSPAAKLKSVIDGVAPSDWERIRLFASTNVDQAKIGEVLDWTNTDTGSNGTLSPLAASRAEGDRQCRAFALTISDLRGIRRYRGDACHTADGMWQLFGVTPEDGALL